MIFLDSFIKYRTLTIWPEFFDVFEMQLKLYSRIKVRYMKEWSVIKHVMILVIAHKRSIY